MDRANELKVFSGNANKQLARAICTRLGIEPIRGQVTRFSDHEIRVEIDESVRGDDVFIVQPTCAPVNDHLMELLIAIDAFRRASAARMPRDPYFGYARRIRRSGARADQRQAHRHADHRSRGPPRSDHGLHALQIQGFSIFLWTTSMQGRSLPTT